MLERHNTHSVFISPRKSTSWHTALRLRKKSEKKDKDGKREGKLENGYRKSREGLSNKVSVKVCSGVFRSPCHPSMRERIREGRDSADLKLGLLMTSLPPTSPVPCVSCRVLLGALCWPAQGWVLPTRNQVDPCTLPQVHMWLLKNMVRFANEAQRLGSQKQRRCREAMAQASFSVPALEPRGSG